jgi:hypothetical protein
MALYADPARARENAPSIRGNAARFHGSVDRLRRVTIVWVKPPSGALRDAVHACVAGARP